MFTNNQTGQLVQKLNISLETKTKFKIKEPGWILSLASKKQREAEAKALQDRRDLFFKNEQNIISDIYYRDYSKGIAK